MPPRPARTEEERFNSFLAPPDENGCILFTGATARGYGAFSVYRDGKRKMVVASRYAWEREKGPIPQGIFVCHHCDVRRCVNVDHLFLGTCADNLRDMREKDRGSKPPLSGLGLPPTNAKLTFDDAENIRSMYLSGLFTQRQIATIYGIDQVNVSCIVLRKTWKHPRPHR